MAERWSQDPQGRFATTQWSLVVASAGGEGPGAREALAELCRIYWPPVYAHLRRRGTSIDRALDITQGFFATLLEKNYVAEARRDRGRFRTFLLASLAHYEANVRDHERALKRGGGRVPISLDAVRAEEEHRVEPSHDETAEKIFDRRWARALLRASVDRLRDEMDRAGKKERCGTLLPYLVGDSDRSFREAGTELGINETAARVAAHRMKHRFRTILREEVARTVAEPSQVEAELRHLFHVLGSAALQQDRNETEPGAS